MSPQRRFAYGRSIRHRRRPRRHEGGPSARRTAWERARGLLHPEASRPCGADGDVNSRHPGGLGKGEPGARSADRRARAGAMGARAAGPRPGIQFRTAPCPARARRFGAQPRRQARPATSTGASHRSLARRTKAATACALSAGVGRDLIRRPAAENVAGRRGSRFHGHQLRGPGGPVVR